jgi:hypothetical protein
MFMPLSSSGLGHLVLIQEITGSNPVRGTILAHEKEDYEDYED